MQDVPAALRRRGLTFTCYEDPTRQAVVDGEHSVRVNYETYLFADTAARDRFLDALDAACGFVTDPVSKNRFTPTASSPRMQFQGVHYIFEDATNAHDFSVAPHVYQLPHFRM